MPTSSIRFAPDILKRLGEELNPSIDQGIIELVKNSYDADARECTVSLTGTDAPGGSIRVQDDGLGMTADEIANGWLILGHSPKDPHQRTALGRLPAGSKGLGRLAALRMGDRAGLRTRPAAEQGVEYRVTIEWAAYADASVVEDVLLEVRRRQVSKGSPRLTQIEVTGLARPLRRAEVQSLSRALILLGDPFGDDAQAFRPRLLAPEFSDLETLVQNRYFNDADYHLVAELDPTGLATARVLDWRGLLLFEGDHGQIARNSLFPRYECPPVRFDLWVYILRRDSFAARPVSLGEVKAWLGAFGGVHLYVNGIRVAPYGNPGNDWLEMNLRRVRSPEERPSTNNSIGKFAVDDSSGLLVPKTDRSGFIEDQALAELRRFGQDALDWMSRRRLDSAERRRGAERATSNSRVVRARTRLQQEVARLPDPTRQQAIQKALSSYDSAREREANVLKREVQLYRTLSTAGITAATFAHETSGNSLKVLGQALKAVERRAKQRLGNDLDGLAEPINTLRGALQSLSSLSSTTLGLLSPDKRRTGRVDLYAVIQDVTETFRPIVESRGIRLDIQLGDGRPFLRGTEAAIESILTNLLNNSVAALESGGRPQSRGGDGEPIVAVRADADGGQFRLRVADSGPGITGLPVSAIWLPGETTREGGTGLGLAIVRDAAIDLGGKADAWVTGEYGGAEFEVELPVLGV